MTTENQTLLTQDLKRFGLNPQDWSLVLTENREFQIRHQLDSEFILRGKCSESYEFKWEFIALESL